MDLGNYEEWFRDKGDYTHRLNYDLNENSLVFDVGGYQGWFTEQINNKYRSKIFCFEPIRAFFIDIENKFSEMENVKLFNFAISNKNGEGIIYLDNDATGAHVQKNQPFGLKIECVTLDKIMKDYDLSKVDLIKINIEGEEYSLLEYMIEKNLIEKFENIQVQFHKIVSNWDVRYENIKNELEKTHHLTYRYPFIWENWKKN